MTTLGELRQLVDELVAAGASDDTRVVVDAGSDESDDFLRVVYEELGEDWLVTGATYAGEPDDLVVLHVDREPKR